MTKREWPLRCESCGHKEKQWAWDYELPLACKECGQPSYVYYEPRGQAPGVITDNIAGGMEIRHGICHEDGTPRRIDSKTELKQALNEKGLTIKGDTPKPYKVKWSGKPVDSAMGTLID